MGKRLENGEWQDSCLDKLKPGEPFFVLRAQDRYAADLVRSWAHRAMSTGISQDRAQEAFDCATAMDQWPTKKFPD